MPNCQNCGRQWDWKTAATKTLKLTNEATCPHCGKTQYILPKSRKASGVLGYLPAFILIVSSLIFNLSVLEVILFAVVLFIVFIILYPHSIKLSSGNEPLW